MAELEIDGTHEEQFAVVKSTLKQHHNALYGNGQSGIVDFVSSTRGQFRLIIILITVLGILVSIVAALEANRQFHSRILGEGPVVARQENSAVPNLPKE